MRAVHRRAQRRADEALDLTDGPGRSSRPSGGVTSIACGPSLGGATSSSSAWGAVDARPRSKVTIGAESWAASAMSSRHPRRLELLPRSMPPATSTPARDARTGACARAQPYLRHSRPRSSSSRASRTSARTSRRAAALPGGHVQAGGTGVVGKVRWQIDVDTSHAHSIHTCSSGTSETLRSEVTVRRLRP